MRTGTALFFFFLLALLGTGAGKSLAQDPYAGLVQINGVITTADSLRAVGGATVLVKGKNRGVESSPKGVFSIVVLKGDTLQFSALGFRDKEFIVPATADGHYLSIIQLMVQDTFYLPETIVKPLPTKEGFDYAFKNWKIPDDQYELARKNTDAYTLRVLAYTLPRDGREFQSVYQSQQAQAAVYYGQQRPMTALSPLAWAEFFEAWKRGDFRRKY